MKPQMTNEKFLELSSDIAEDITAFTLGVLIWETGEDGTERLVGTAQDLFNETLDIIQERLLNDIEITNLPITNK